MKRILSNYYSGTSGLALPVPNKLLFPKEFRDKSRLNYYGTLFNSIEINSTFKKLPRFDTIVKWTADVPENFRFTFKIPQVVSHAPMLKFDPENVYRFMEVILATGNKKGSVLIQFPGKLTAAESPRLKSLLTTIRKAKGGLEWKLAVEFRHASWYTEKTNLLLQQFGATRVIHDLPSFHAPAGEYEFFPEMYLRLHGPEKGYRGSYSDEFLLSHARQIGNRINEGKEVYVYLNNTLGDAAKNLSTLNQMVMKLTA